MDAIEKAVALWGAHQLVAETLYEVSDVDIDAISVSFISQDSYDGEVPMAEVVGYIKVGASRKFARTFVELHGKEVHEFLTEVLAYQEDAS